MDVSVDVSLYGGVRKVKPFFFFFFFFFFFGTKPFLVLMLTPRKPYCLVLYLFTDEPANAI